MSSVFVSIIETTPTPIPPPSTLLLGINMTGVFQGSGIAPVVPGVQNFQYYVNFGIKLFRLLFTWSITQTFPPFATTGIQLTTFTSLDAGYLASLDQAITNAIAAGGKCRLDCHMFMVGPGGFNVGTTQVPTTALADMWGKIAAHYVANPTLLAGISGMELMNEPPNGFPTPTILTCFQECITSIRNAGYVGPIYIDGANYSSAWNWVSGGGQPYNSSSLIGLIDPLNNLIFTAHIYPDPDDSGSHGSYANSIAIPGSAPPGIDTNPQIFVQRTSLEFVPWVQENGLRGDIGEYGSSNDSPDAGGAFNFAAWNAITFNGLQYLQAQGIPVSVWSGGPGFPAGFAGYFYSLDPFSSALDGSPDFTSTGVQAPAIAILQQFTGYSGPQPTAYAFMSPAFPTSGGIRATPGTPTGNFTIYYGGVLSIPKIITPTVYLEDGVTIAPDVTVTPSTVTLAPGTNPLGTFTFETSVQNRYLIKLTNNAGLANPPPISVSSLQDNFVTIPSNQIQGVWSLALEYTLYSGAAFIVLHPTFGTEITLSYASDGAPDVATWKAACGGASSVKIIRIFNQGPAGSINDMTPLWGYPGASGSNVPNSGYGPASSPSDYPTLLFSDTDGNPSIVFSGSNRMYTNVDTTSVVTGGDTGLSISGRFNDASSNYGFLSQNLFAGGPLTWGPAIGISIQHGATAGVVATLNYSASPGNWQTYGVTMQSSTGGTTTNGLVMYLNSTQNNQANMPAYSFDPQFNATSTDIAYDRYVGGLAFTGSWRSLRVLTGASPVSSTIMGEFSATDTANWGNPFP